ncbi:MAG: PKD domain-containing protein [Thermoplasmata archaeon]|nr:PKD domain-containing protein [Thermoplasmata archaeon]
MKKLMVLLSFISIILAMLPSVEARVDARFIIKDLSGRQIYMRTPDGKIIFGNVVVGQEIIFDASASNSMYPIDRYYWDFDGDGKYDKITSTPIVHYTYKKAGEYNAKLMAVATSAPPAGDGDTITHKIVVVEKLLPPVAIFEIERKGKGTFVFNASQSYDPDGYIKSYLWDFDGDGKYDASGKNVTWAYEKNGYYFPELKVIDYDLKYNFTKRVIRVDCLNGSIEEKEGVINIKNRYGHTVNLTIVVNNDETVNVSVEKEMSVKVPISTSLNEICVEYNGKKTVILFEGDEADIVVDKNGVHKATGKSPGMEFLFIIATLIMIFLMRRK